MTAHTAEFFTMVLPGTHSVLSAGALPTFWPMLAYEKLAELHDIHLSKETRPFTHGQSRPLDSPQAARSKNSAALILLKPPGVIWKSMANYWHCTSDKASAFGINNTNATGGDLYTKNGLFAQ